MKLQSSKINWQILRFIVLPAWYSGKSVRCYLASFNQIRLLIDAIIHAMPVDQQKDPQQFTGSNLNENTLFNGLTISNENIFENENTEHIIERPCNDLWGTFQEIENPNDFKMYRQVNKGEQFKRLCWAELLIITEDNASKNKTLSREYLIILENPGDTLEENIEDGKYVEQYEIFDETTKESKKLNFTTVRKTKNSSFKEHKLMFCGTGPVLTKEYIESPNLNKKKIEIRLSPATSTTWKLYNEDMNLSETQYTQPTIYSTFDTIKTNKYPMFTTTEISTEGISNITYDPSLLEENVKEENQFKINSNKSTSLLYESSERFNPFYSDTNTDRVNNSIQDNNLYSDNYEDSTTKYQLTHNVLLKQNENINEQSYQNKSEPNDKESKASFLLNFLFPNKLMTDLISANSNNKVLSKVKIHLEHRTTDNVTNHEKTNSVVEIEEDSIFHIVSKTF